MPVCRTALRDALSLFDQCAAAGGAIDAPAVLDALGLAGNVQTAQMMELILRAIRAGRPNCSESLYDGGKEWARCSASYRRCRASF